MVDISKMTLGKILSDPSAPSIKLFKSLKEYLATPVWDHFNFFFWLFQVKASDCSKTSISKVTPLLKKVLKFISFSSKSLVPLVWKPKWVYYSSENRTKNCNFQLGTRKYFELSIWHRRLHPVDFFEYSRRRFHQNFMPWSAHCKHSFLRMIFETYNEKPMIKVDVHVRESARSVLAEVLSLLQDASQPPSLRQLVHEIFFEHCSLLQATQFCAASANFTKEERQTLRRNQNITSENIDSVFQMLLFVAGSKQFHFVA